MIIIKLIGWLWNQMFQYALWKSLSIKYKTDFKFDISWFKQYKSHKYCLESFNISRNYASKNEIPFYQKIFSKNKYINIWILIIRLVCKRLNPHHSIEKQFNFDQTILWISSWYVEWYFQTEKYFMNYEDDIRKDFKFIIPPSERNQEYINIIHSCNAVSLHIRRWDYVSNPSAKSFHGTCNLNYYRKAIEIIKTKIENPVFFIFSDDMNWAKENLIIEEKGYYVDFNNIDTNYEDMRLMSLCKHNIIANSSFSWWGAWLNKNKEKIVIAPKKWFNNKKINFNDIIPANWIKI